MSVVNITIVLQPRPLPADDINNADDRLQATNEMVRWLQWPYEVQVETDDDFRILYGGAALTYLQAWIVEQSKE